MLKGANMYLTPHRLGSYQFFRSILKVPLLIYKEIGTGREASILISDACEMTSV
jgi:hypothetical protein